MTKSKSIVSKLLVLVVILTLISCCFLGSTFARYASDGSGSATMNVAKWDVSAEESSIDVNFEKLSPLKEAYQGGDTYKAENVRKHSTERVLAATIKNAGDVNALVTLTAGNETIVNALTDDWGVYNEETIKGLFDIVIYTNTENAPDGASKYTDAINLAATNGVLYVFVEVTWTSDDETVYGETADVRDTWVGENITSVSYTLSFTAVQNTQIPA